MISESVTVNTTQTPTPTMITNIIILHVITCHDFPFSTKEHQGIDYRGIHKKLCHHLVSLRTAAPFLNSAEDRDNRKDQILLLQVEYRYGKSWSRIQPQLFRFIGIPRCCKQNKTVAPRAKYT